jgi:HD-like signal output (HDOD) protein
VADRIVADLGVPPCPAIVIDLLAESRRDEPDFPRIGALISRDPGLAAALMKTVNSPFYSVVVKATSVQQALLFLGLRSALRIVTGLALRHAFPATLAADTDPVWSNAARLAPVLGCLAHATRRADRDDAYTFGLFRDCGTLLMMGRHGPLYAEALREHGFPHTLTLLALESGIAGTDHAQAGFALAKSWYLPETLCYAVRHHHDGRALSEGLPLVNREARALVALGFLADRILDPSPSAVAEVVWARWRAQVLATLGLDEADVPALAEEALAAAAD